MITRGQLLQRYASPAAPLALGAGLPPILAGCSAGDPLGESVAGLPKPYATWMLLQRLARTSADHLPAVIAIRGQFNAGTGGSYDISG